MHKFLIGTNPQAPDTGGLWVIHLINPKSIIEVVPFGTTPKSKKAIYARDFEFISSDGELQVWQLRLYHCFIPLTAEMVNEREVADKLLKDAWHWLSAFFKIKNNGTN